jgi:hypothetical protein
LSSVEQVARKYVRYHYGELLSAGDTKLNKTTGLWETEIFSNYPRIIRDDEKPDSPWVKFITLRNLGKIELDEKSEVISATPRPEIAQLVRERLTLFRQRAESIMVRASSFQFGRLGETRHVLRPVVEIVQNLLFKRDGYGAELKEEYFLGDDDSNNWLSLLERIGVIVKTPKGDFASSPLFIDWLAKYRKDPDMVINIVLSELIKQELPALKSAFVIAQLDKHIRVDNSYYWQALDAGESFHARWDSLRDRYISYYSKMISVNSFCSTLYELQTVDAIRQGNDNHYYANPDILKEMLKEKADFLEGMSRKA